MIYPKYIKKKDYIGVCAPSDGITKELKIKRVDNAYKNLSEYGFNIIETESVRNSINGKSNTNEIIAKELDSLIANDKVKWIICATGGDFLLEVLPYFNYKNIINNIKWIQGYSDITALLYVLTTKYDIATVYGYNIASFGMENWHKSIYDNIHLLEGNIDEINSYDYYENDYHNYITGLEEFSKDKLVSWKTIDNNEVNITGRIIGGCIDVIISLIGTKYDNTKEFIEKYKEDGIIWYFDNYGLVSEEIMHAMWQLDNAGYFKYTKGIIFGRSVTEESYNNISFKQALIRSLHHLNIPIVYDADIGHKHPEMSIINGSIATIKCIDNKGYILQKLI